MAAKGNPKRSSSSPKPNPGRAGRTCYRLLVEYRGSQYHGWQEQKNARSVAGELRQALTAAGAEIIELGGAGRTDRGVHALGQVAHLRVARPLAPATLNTLLGAVNDALPADIHVLSIEPAAPEFHARHDATARSYVYQVSRRRQALTKQYVWWVKRPLHLARMRACLALVVGRHDFAKFCERPQDQPSTVVVVEAAELIEDGSLIVIRLQASHFLWKMVRRVVGTVVEVGAGALTVDDFATLVAGGNLPAAVGETGQWTAPASGLFLERVLYPGSPPIGPLRSALAVAD